MGHEGEAKKVRIALERERHRHEFAQRKQLGVGVYGRYLAYARWIGRLGQRLILNYGYDTWRPARIMAALWLVGSLLFLSGYRAGLMAPASDQVLTWEKYAAGPGRRKDEATSPTAHQAAAQQITTTPAEETAASPADQTSPPIAELPKSTGPSVESLLPPDYPQFNAAIYSLHVLLPIVDLRQQEYWLPSIQRGWRGWDSAGSALRWYMWFQTLSGWVLALFLIAGLTGLVKHKPVGGEDPFAS